jgi:AAA+ ATPase superfamily predicted ATPase
MADTLKPNPYDYINEVTDPNQFAGREEELAIIEEEISRLAGANPIIPVLALIGDRRVGKTSLMLRVRELCDELNTLAVCVIVRI